MREDLYKCIQDAPVSEGKVTLSVTRPAIVVTLYSTENIVCVGVCFPALKLVQSITRGPNPELSKALHEYGKRFCLVDFFFNL